MADGQVKFTIVIDKDTGAVKGVTQALEQTAQAAKKVGDTSAKAATTGGDSFKTMGGKVKEFAMGVLVAQLAMEGLRKLAQNNDAFQELQATFNGVAKELIEVLQPALSMIAKGLSGLLTIFGAAGKAFKAMASGEWSQAGTIMAEGVERAAGIIEGRVQVMTKAMADASIERLTQEQTHAQAVAQLRQADADRQLQQTNLTDDQRLALIKEKQDAELQGMRTVEKAKEEQLQVQRDTNLITEAVYQQKLKTIRQQASDAEKAVRMKNKTEVEAIERSRVAKLQQFFQAEINAGANAAAQRYAQTKNVGEAVKAGGAAMVEAAAQYAAQYIAIKGAEAAADAYIKVSSATPGPVGIAAGIAAAGGVMAWYGGLAALVGGAGSALAGAMGGGGGGGGTETAGGGGGAVTAGGGSDLATAPVGASSPGTGGGGGMVGGGGGGGTGGVQVAVYLDGDVLFNAITNASRDGRVMIYSRSVVP